MKTISLKLYLMIFIVLIATLCLFATAAFVLYQADTQSKQSTINSAKSIDQQLEMQRFRISKGLERPERFPDFDFWKASDHSSGLCARFARVNGDIVKSVCRGGMTTEQWPDWFETIYRWCFQPGQEITREVTPDSQTYGFVTVSPSAEIELARAWREVKKLLGLSTVTVVSLCLLLYFAIDWALRPTRLIVSRLDIMAHENLSIRLPNFHITEWQQTGQAINYLAANLDKTLAERKSLALKLVNSQEQERLFLARELHDEFGQSLSGIAALASSITQTAKKQCPNLVPETQQIGRISSQMMGLVRNLLLRLRPIDLDELGLIESLKSMIKEWNIRNGSAIRYNIDIIGHFDNLPDPIPAHIFRIIQEALTNITKHSNATYAEIKLERVKHSQFDFSHQVNDCINLVIQDNGVVDDIEFATTPGMGLLGIHERVSALGGRLDLQPCQPSGLRIHIQIPLQDSNVSLA